MTCISKRLSGALISVYGFDSTDWHRLVTYAAGLSSIAGIELNLSCPNVAHRQIVHDVLPAVRICPERLVAKLPPIRWREFAEPLYQAGVRAFHCCNTLWSPGGGLSGAVLKPYSLWAIEDLRNLFGTDVKLIGGGGIATPQDVYAYKQAGADHVAIASLLLNPLNHMKVRGLCDAAS